MSYPAAGPFLIDPADLNDGSIVTYLSCGVPHDFSATDRDKVRRIFDQAQFIYLRDEQSAEKLRSCGVHREIRVAPDLIVTLSEQFDHGEEAIKGRQILAKLGVKEGSRILCFQSKAFPGFDTEEIVELLNCYRRQTGWEIVLLPLGYCHDDDRFLRRLAKESRGAFKYANVYSVFEIISVIAACDLFVGTSLHGNIAAFSFAIPHLLGPLPLDKCEGFLSTVNLPSQLKLRSWSEINKGIDLATGLGRDFFAERALEAKAKVYAAVDEILPHLMN
jgi:hypothetical protein